MNKFARNLGVALISLLSASTYAKTFKYDLTAIQSFQGPIHYPNLDFNHAKSAIFTVNKDPLSPDVQISSLELNFPTAAKLTATGFKQVEHNLYRAVVNDVWIYRQVIVDVRDVDFNNPLRRSGIIEVYLSEKSVFINPENDMDFRGEPLFMVNGVLRDLTTSRIADTAITTIESKKLTLSLKDLLSFAPHEAQVNGAREGFVIDALWQGKGQKTIFVPAIVPLEEFDRYTAIGLVLTERESPFGKEIFYSIKFKEDGNTQELMTPEQPLKPLIDSAFGTAPW